MYWLQHTWHVAVSGALCLDLYERRLRHKASFAAPLLLGGEGGPHKMGPAIPLQALLEYPDTRAPWLITFPDKIVLCHRM